jgi:hypothetical protein
MKAPSKAGQKPAHVEAPASDFQAPARPFTVPSPPDGQPFDHEARIENARRFGHNALQLRAPEPSSQAPIQRTNGKGKKKENQNQNQRTPLLGTTRGRTQVLIDERPDIQQSHHDAIATPLPDDVSTGLTIASGAGSGARFGARVADALHAQLPSAVSPGLGVAANPLSAVGSSVDAYMKLQQVAQGSNKKKDKALLGMGAVSDLANATVSGASTAMQGAELAGSTLGGALQVAGPAAMVMGGMDLVGGLVSNRMAAHRQSELERIQQTQSDLGFHGDAAIAKFAKGSQETKKKRSLGTALKGGLALGGGIALALGAGPIGWGLLGGAALVGGAMTLYKQYRKHKQGKEILNDPQQREHLESAGIRIPDANDLKKQSWLKRWNPLNTKESRTHDLIRGQIAEKLQNAVNDPHHNDVQNDDGRNSPLTAIAGHLGIKNKGKKARARDIASALQG